MTTSEPMPRPVN